MTHAETRSLGYAAAGSLAVHVLLAVSVALWIGLTSLNRIRIPMKEVVEEEPDVVIVIPDLALPPPTPQQDQNYIRTTQNTEAAQAPAKADFVSDKNTVASAKSAPSPNGDQALPSMQGVDFATKELANRDFRDGETKNDSAPASPETPSATTVATPSVPPPPPPSPPVPPQMKVPDVVPQPQIATKEDSPAEVMMKELDEALAQKKEKPEETKTEDQPPDPSKPDVKMGSQPLMRTPEEMGTSRAIPMAKPVVNTPRPEKNAFQPETHRGAVKGTISNLGKEDAVNAAATPVGRYMRQVTGAIEKKWHQFRMARADAVEPGKMGLRFFVNKNGKVEDLEFLFKESNPLMEDFTIDAILKAEIPPIPKDLLPILDKERVEMTYDIVIHP